MMKTARTITKNFWLVSLLACFVALSLSFVGSSSAFAATQHHSNVKPNYVSVQCLEETAYLTENGENSADGVGESYNNCLATVYITQIINLTSSCPGLGTGSGSITTGGSTAVGLSFIQNFGTNAGCVVCEYTDGVLSGESFPNFTLLETVTASGSFTYHGISYRATSDTGSDRITISNGGKYAPPCPESV